MPLLRTRFNLRQLLVAFSLIAVSLGVCILLVQWRRHAYVSTIYGRYDVYRALCASERLEIFRVKPGKLINPAIDPWQIPDKSRFQPCTRNTTLRLRQLLTNPQNFDVRFVKDFMFGPTYMVRASAPGQRVEVYLDFTSLVAAIVVEGEWVWTLYPDNIAAELEQALAESCGDTQPP